ncbi:MAG: trypsin-like serine protease [Planctomycetota bacterium]
MSPLLVLLIAFQAAAIDYGTPVGDGQYPTVGMVVVHLGENHTVLGTGTLIGRNVVLTAAHVIQDSTTPGHITFRMALGGGKTFNARVLVYRTHPGYLNLRSDSLIHDDERTFMDTDLIAASASDMALLLLDKPLPDDMPLYPLLEKQPQPGAEVTAIGFGLDEGKKSGNPRKLQGKLQFLKEQDRALLFRTPKGSNQRTDHGDSGGPLLIQEDGQEKIAAITHGFFTAIKVDGLSPDEYGIYVSVPAQADWIKATRDQLARYKPPASPAYYLTRNNRHTPFLAVTARQMFSLANADTPIERLVGRAFVRGINEPIPGDVATGWQKRYKLPPGMLVPLKSD